MNTTPEHQTKTYYETEDTNRTIASQNASNDLALWLKDLLLDNIGAITDLYKVIEDICQQGK